MAFTTAAQLKAALDKAVTISWYTGSPSLSGGSYAFYFAQTADVPSGSLTFTDVVAGTEFNYSSAGAKRFPGGGGTDPVYLATLSGSGSAGIAVGVYDLLWGVGPIPTRVAQTLTFSGQATAWEDRVYGDFKSVQMFCVSANSNGAYATTVTVSYTNEDNVSGRTATIAETLNGSTTAKTFACRLQSGDSGVRKVDSVTVAATLSSSGIVDIILARLVGYYQILPLGMTEPPVEVSRACLTKIHPDSCLAFICRPIGTNPLFVMSASFIKE